MCPPPDTSEQIRWRLADNAARAFAGAERQRVFPVITPENFEAALAFQETAIVEERETTLVIPRRWTASVHSSGAVVARREG